MQDILFNSRIGYSTSTSLVVPETPEMSCPSTSMAAVSTLVSVMETPDEEVLNVVNKDETNASNENHEKSEDVQENDCDENDESDLLYVSPDLNLGRRKKLLSLLESEHSFTKSLQSQKIKNSSMLFRENNVGKKKKLRERVGMLSPVKGRKRLSLADTILPFDLNNSKHCSHKLKGIEKREKSRKSISTPTNSRLANLNTSQTQSSTKIKNVRQENTQFEKGNNLTIYFDSEDILLTPVSSSQHLIENAVQSIVDGLESQQLVDGNEHKVAMEHQVQESAAATEHDCNLNNNSKKKHNDATPAKLDCSWNNNLKRKNNDSNDTTAKEPAESLPELSSILLGVVAYVEVRMGSDNRSAVIKEQVRALGAEVRERLTAAVTHVIFKDGSKSVFNRAVKSRLHLVSSLWVEACREKRQHVPEALFPSCSIDLYKAPMLPTKLRRLKSMQPKELSEEENLAAARARRRIKTLSSSSTPSSLKSELQFSVPSYSSINEARDSPLFGIGHLLTPQRRKSGSSTSSEEEEINPVSGMPQDINSPLVQRLYKRFISPKCSITERPLRGSIGDKEQGLTLNTSSDDASCESDREISERGRVHNGTLENLECQMTVASDESMNLRLSLMDNSDNNEGGDMPIRLTEMQPKANTRTVNCVQNGKKNAIETVYSKPRRRNRKLVDLSDVNKRLTFETSDCSNNENSLLMDSSLEHCNSVNKPEGCGTINSVPQSLDKCDTIDSVPTRSDRCGRIDKVLPLSSRCVSNHNHKSVENKSPQKRKSTSSEENIALYMKDSNPKRLIGSKQGEYEIATEASEITGRITRSSTNSNSNKLTNNRTSITKIEKQKSVRCRGKRKVNDNTTSEKDTPESSYTYKDKVVDCSIPTNSSQKFNSELSKQAERLSSKDIKCSRDNQFPSVSDSHNNSYFSSSQVRRRKLLSMDVMNPSQELIIPVTPDAREKLTSGPYAELQIKGTRTQRAMLRNHRDRSASIPLPRNHKTKSCNKKLSTEFCSLLERKKYESISEENELNKIDSDTSLSSQNMLHKESTSEDETLYSSGNDSVFQKSKIKPLPRTRRSTEEFEFKNGITPKGGKRDRPKRVKKLSMCITSVHSKEMSILIPIIKKLGSYGVTEHVNSDTSHVVCGAARRTMNLLLGIARGCWIVDVSWLYQSLEMGTWAPEEPFEIFTFAPGAKICREQKQLQGASYKHTLFSGVGGIFVLEGCVPPSDQLQLLLHLCGAVVVSNIRSANLVIGIPTAASGARGNFAQITHVSEKWVLDSIQHHKIHPFHDYSLSPTT